MFRLITTRNIILQMLPENLLKLQLPPVAVLHLKTLYNQVLYKSKHCDMCCCDGERRTKIEKRL